MKNKEIRILLLENNIKMWQIAQAYGCTDSTLSKVFRKELDKDTKNKILQCIKQINQK